MRNGSVVAADDLAVIAWNYVVAFNILFDYYACKYIYMYVCMRVANWSQKLKRACQAACIFNCFI